MRVSQVNLHAEHIQIRPRLACKIACSCSQKYMQFAGKKTRIAGENIYQTQAKVTANASKNTCTNVGKNARNRTKNYLQLQAICYHTAGKFTFKLQVKLPATWVLYYVLSRVYCVRCLSHRSSYNYLFLQVNCMQLR